MQGASFPLRETVVLTPCGLVFTILLCGTCWPMANDLHRGLFLSGIAVVLLRPHHARFLNRLCQLLCAGCSSCLG